MKKCRKCGAYNSNERQYCVDCAQRLGEGLSEQEEENFTWENTDDFLFRYTSWFSERTAE